MKRLVDDLRDTLEQNGLPVTKVAAGVFQDLFAEGAKLGREHEQDFHNFESTLANELRTKIIYRIPTESAALLDSGTKLFGEAVDTAFPSASFDIAEAGKCLAFSRGTACVMHLMRALETPLKAMSKEFSVYVGRDNWHDVLTPIEAAVLALNPKTDAERKQFFSAACAQFRFFKDAWRNHVMHAKEKHTEEEADIIFRSVKAFMGQLAKRIKE